MTEELKTVREEILRIIDGLCVTDWKYAIEDDGLSVTLSVHKDELMDVVRLIDEL